MARVHYSHHPQAGNEVGVLARRHSSGSLHVLLPDGSTATLPEWMFDAAYCQAMVSQETPQVSLSALRDLRRLVDTGLLVCDPNPLKKDTHDETAQAPAGTAFDQRDGMGGIAGGSEEGMPSTHRPTAAGSPAERKGGVP